MDKFKDGKFWIIIGYVVLSGKRRWYWNIKSCNGRLKAMSNNTYPKRSLAYNDAKSFADYVHLVVRE